MGTRNLNIGMIGYGFMGRAHSNAYRKVNNFFPLEYRPVLKAAGLLKRDPRSVERKKFGHKKARRSFQFSKR